MGERRARNAAAGRRVVTAVAVLATLAMLGAVSTVDTGPGDAVPVQVLAATEFAPLVTDPLTDAAVASTRRPPTGSVPSDASPDETAPPSTTAPSPTTVPAGDESGAELGGRALGTIAFDWSVRLANWQIVFESARDDIRGLTIPSERRIEIYIREGDDIDLVARVIAHEIGHAIDLEFNDVDERAAWRRARGVDDDVPWWPDGTSFDFDTLAGDFAEAFAVYETGVESRSRIGGPLTPEQMDLLELLVS